MPETYYTRPVTTPKNMQEGLANAVQLVINAIEAGEYQDALLLAVDLHGDIASKANPYRVEAGKKRASRKMEYRGTVNVD